ncbi:MBL fold metallo-hydrolase [Paenibacillus sp. PL2-23]|uniref:MBL fold metallo-hydrolase n=1 Tax=Paenibacillus sp. PL2-23 TaxID=2100729 RepID=UPI0030FA0921
MIIQFIRHATLSIKFGGQQILIDPMLSSSGTMEPVAGSADDRRNPLVDLTVPLEELLQPNAVLLTHTHRDHFDDKAAELLNKDVKFFCQPQDAVGIAQRGFTSVVPIEGTYPFKGITITRISGKHGTGAMAQKMGSVSGYILQADHEETLYLAGDTVWCEEVSQAISAHRPQIIVVNGGAAEFLEGGPVTMSLEDIRKVREQAPEALLIVVHMEAWGHCMMSRSSARRTSDHYGLSLMIPEDGEYILT